MMTAVARIDGRGADASAGRVVWSPAKSAWNMSMLGCSLVFAPLTVTPGAVLLFAISTYLSLLLGHSVGMHRRFIHRSYSCRKWLERALIYHHAFPESARIGLEPGQTDPAASVIETLAKLGWAWNLGTPRTEAQREDLFRAA